MSKTAVPNSNSAIQYFDKWQHSFIRETAARIEKMEATPISTFSSMKIDAEVEKLIINYYNKSIFYIL